MGRNRRTNSAAVRFGPVLKTLLLCLLIGGVGLGYVWQVNQIYALGQQKRQAENRLRELQRQNKTHRDHLDYLRLPWVLEARIKELNLGLGPPQAEQVLRLAEPLLPPTATVKLPPIVEDRAHSFTSR